MDLIYPMQPAAEADVVARTGKSILGVRRSVMEGRSLTFLGFRARDDQAASLGYETRPSDQDLQLVSAGNAGLTTSPD